MAVHDGCKSGKKTARLEERICPVCGEDMDVFMRDGRVIEDSVCVCGYTIKADEAFGYKTRFEVLQEEEVARVNAQSRGIEN
ncbi:MAG: hypothetical protein IKM61_05150 [Eubacteriaceae bacterium]|nr:hypothetical protein [Eubacteriaceae bacterium]